MADRDELMNGKRVVDFYRVQYPMMVMSAPLIVALVSMTILQKMLLRMIWAIEAA